MIVDNNFYSNNFNPYVAGSDVARVCFAVNDTTLFSGPELHHSRGLFPGGPRLGS